MKHFRKVCAVLLAMLMVAVILPSTGLLTFENDPIAPSVQAAEVGVVVNGDFSQSEKTLQQIKEETDSCGNTTQKEEYYYHATGWEQNKWAVNITSGYANFSKDSSVANAVGLSQLVPVNTNATYELTFTVRYGNPCFTYKITGTSESGEVLASGTPSSGSSAKTNTVEFKTGSHNYVCIQFVCTGTGSSDSRLDDVALSVVDSGDTGTHAKPTLKSWGTEKNRPASSSDNVIVQPGFESTTNAQWYTTDFVDKQGVSIATDASIAHSGSKYLKYEHTGNVAYTNWPMFEFTCPTAGEYVFSAWVRTPLLSANNVGAASIGIINPDTNKFATYGNAGGSYDGHYSNPETQLRSTATDDNWHLRSVTFYVGENNSIVKIGMYGLKSTMYVDDISVHLLSKGTKYVGNQSGALSASTSVTNKYCESEDNLIPDCNMNGNPSKDFWSKSSGWNNGFLEFNKDATSAAHGNALHFKGTSPASNKTYRYIKFVPVEPNTSYTVSFDYRVVKTGNPLVFIDNNINKNAEFHTPNLGSASNSWKEYAFTFNTGNYNRIGIVFKDGTGEAYFDDFRFFKSSDGISTEPEEEIFPTLKHTGGEESRMEMDSGKLGLAFRFNLACTGVTVNGQYIGDYTNGKVDPFENGGEYKLIAAGAVMTNDASVGQDESRFIRENENKNDAKTVVDVNAKYLFADHHREHFGIEGDGISYAVRITNIPEAHKGTVIYARPYYVFEYEGKEITVYGDIAYDCYEKIPDINDGWLEWD